MTHIVWILISALDFLMFCIAVLNFALSSYDRKLGLLYFKPIKIFSSICCWTSWNFYPKVEHQMLLLLSCGHSLAKCLTDCLYPCKLLQQEMSILSFIAYWVLDVLPTSILWIDILFSSSTTFVASISETPKAPDDACFDTTELACLQKF